MSLLVCRDRMLLFNVAVIRDLHNSEAKLNRQ